HLRAWPAGAIWSAAVELIAQAADHAAGNQRRVDQQGTGTHRLLDITGQPFAKEVAQWADAAGRDGQARRHGMAAAGYQQAAVLGGEHGRAKIDSTDRAARPLA